MNRDEVISGLEKCAASECNEKCQYSSINCGCRPRLMLDAMELLKEQPEIVRCKDCKHAVLTTSGEVKYCKCWQSDEDGTYGGDPLYLDGNYYCADGERRDGDE